MDPMSDSAAKSRDDWYQEAARAQIQSERMGRAELLNGRVAMLGFLIGLLTEVITGQASPIRSASVCLVSVDRPGEVSSPIGTVPVDAPPPWLFLPRLWFDT